MPAGMDPVLAPGAPSAAALPQGKEGAAAGGGAPASSSPAANAGRTPEKSGLRRSGAEDPPSLAGLSLGPGASPVGGPETPAPRAGGGAAGASPPALLPPSNADDDDLLASPPRPGAARRGLSFPSSHSPSPPEVLAAVAAMSPLPARPGLGAAREEDEAVKQDGGSDAPAAAPQFVEPLLDPSDDRFTMYPIK